MVVSNVWGRGGESTKRTLFDPMRSSGQTIWKFQQEVSFFFIGKMFHRREIRIESADLHAPAPTFYALPPLITAPPPPDIQAPDFSVDVEADMERRIREALRHNAAQMAQQAERRRMEESLPRDLRDSL